MRVSTRRVVGFTLWMTTSWILAVLVIASLAMSDTTRNLGLPEVRPAMRLMNMLVPGIVAGLLASWLELKVIPHHVRFLSVGLVLVLRTVAYAVVACVSLLFALRFAARRRLRISLRELFAGEGFADFLSGADPWQLLLGFIIASFIINGILSLTRILGPGVMPQLLLGKYLRPREEQRAFMFLDLVDATAVAERLGPLAFSEFRNDFFHDLAEPVLNTRGQIVQYAGDEAIITWRLDQALENANCVRCFFLVERQIEGREAHYMRRYGVVPDFKAGVHGGSVVVSEVGDIKREISFSGDTMNTTSRLEGLCRPLGERILVSEVIAESFDGGVEAEDLGDQTLKGKEQQVRVFAVRGVGRA